MAGKDVRYVDSAIYIAWIKAENRGEGDVIHTILNKKIIAVSSVLVRTEVLSLSIPPDKVEVVEKVLQPPRLQIKSVTTRIADLAREIRDYYAGMRKSGRRDLPSISTPDAIHLATCIYYECPIFVTLDGVKENGKRSKLLLLDGMVAGKYPLRICEPGEDQQAWSI